MASAEEILSIPHRASVRPGRLRGTPGLLIFPALSSVGENL
ncbi:MAG TPA: hypothetical protein VFJ16_15595 [Longimicrobium sp.]|nr:hypothetical protein [Longimicrobium sp.]